MVRPQAGRVPCRGGIANAKPRNWGPEKWKKKKNFVVLLGPSKRVSYLKLHPTEKAPASGIQKKSHLAIPALLHCRLPQTHHQRGSGRPTASVVRLHAGVEEAQPLGVGSLGVAIMPHCMGKVKRECTTRHSQGWSGAIAPRSNAPVPSCPAETVAIAP